MKKRYAGYFAEFVARGISASSSTSAWPISTEEAARPGRIADLKFVISLQRSMTVFLHIQARASNCAAFSCAWDGLALNEIDRRRGPSSSTTCCLVRLHELDATLFNSGTLRSQLSSCYLDVSDDLDGITKRSRKTRCLPSMPGGSQRLDPVGPGFPHKGPTASPREWCRS